MDFTTAGPAQNARLGPSQDAMKTSREAEHDQDQHSPGQQQPLCPSGLDHEAKLPTALGPRSTCSATYRKLASHARDFLRHFIAGTLERRDLWKIALRTRILVRNGQGFSVREMQLQAWGVGGMG